MADNPSIFRVTGWLTDPDLAGSRCEAAGLGLVVVVVA
jgi:hypothetical protein